MKLPISIFAGLLLGSAILQAAPQLYDITLLDNQKFTQCRIAYETDNEIKFRGLDQNGKNVTKTIKKKDLFIKRESEKVDTPKEVEEPKKQEEPKQVETKEATPEPEAAPETDEKEQEEADAPAEEAPQPKAEEKEAPVLKSTSAKEQTYNVLQTKIAEIQRKKNNILNISDSAESRYDSTYSSIERSMNKLLEDCNDIDAKQAEFEAISMKDFHYEIVNELSRNMYEVDGTTAYQAMITDMNQKKSSRKIGGLDKFEILRESYQGIPQYPEAHSWYIKTITALQKKWAKDITGEEAKRKKLNQNRREEQEARDQAEYDKLAEILEKNNEHIAHVWFKPKAKNLVMLKAAKVKADDVLRRNERDKKSGENEHIGKVPQLIKNVWSSMDKARDLMVTGQLEEAKEEMDNNEDFKILVRLHKNLLPDQYKNPIREQRTALYNELRDRISASRSLTRTLESKRSALIRQNDSLVKQIDRLNGIVDKEIADQKAEEEERKAAEAAKQQQEAEKAANADKKAK